MNGSLTITALLKRLAEGRPEIHHLDQSVQYAANQYARLLEEHEVWISMAEVGQAIALRAFKEGRAAMQSGWWELSKKRKLTCQSIVILQKYMNRLSSFWKNVYEKRMHSSLSCLILDRCENDVMNNKREAWYKRDTHCLHWKRMRSRAKVQCSGRLWVALN